jgi:hypothetical protein
MKINGGFRLSGINNIIVIVCMVMPIRIILCLACSLGNFTVCVVEYFYIHMIHCRGCFVWEENSERREGAYSRQGNIQLAVTEDVCGQVYANFIKGATLRFVDSHGKGRQYGKLLALKLKRILLSCCAVDAWKEKHSRLICLVLLNELTLEDKRV